MKNIQTISVVYYYMLILCGNDVDGALPGTTYVGMWPYAPKRRYRIAGKFGRELKFGGLEVWLATAKLNPPMPYTCINTYGDPLPN